MIKGIILISSLFLGFQATAGQITKEGLSKYEYENLIFKLCRDTGVFYYTIAEEYYDGRIDKYETEVSRYDNYNVGFYYKRAIDLAKKLPEVSNEEEKKIVIKNFEVKAFKHCLETQEEEVDKRLGILNESLKK